MPNRTVAAILVALIALSAMPMTAAQAPAGSDLQVTSVTLDNPIVNQTTNVVFRVENRGTASISTPFTVFFGDNATAHDADCLTINGHPADDPPGAVEPCYQTIPGLNAGNGVTMSFRWRIPPAKAFAKNGQLTIITLIEPFCTNQDNGCSSSSITGAPASVDGDTSNNRAPWSKTIKTPKVHAWPLREAPQPATTGAPTYVNDFWRLPDVKDDCAEAPEVSQVACFVRPGHIVSSLYHVQNYGNVGDTFTGNYQLEPQYTNLGYQVSFSPPSKYLNPGESADIIINVSVPAQAPAFQRPNINNINFTAWWVSQTDTGISSRSASGQDCPQALLDQHNCDASTVLPFVVAVRHDVNLTTDLKDNFTTVSIANSTFLDLLVKNNGNAPDQYRVVLDRDPARTTINDSWIPSGSLPIVETVQPGQTLTFRPIVVPPSNATKGYYTAAFLVENVANDRPAATVGAKFTLLVDQQYGLSGEIDNGLQRAVPGDAVSFRITLSNPGNGPENLTAVVGHQPSGWPWSLSSSTLALDPFGSAVIYLNATVPANTPADATAAFFVNVTSNDPADKPQLRPAMVSKEADVTVLKGPNAELTAPITSQFVDPGRQVTYAVHVRNVGNEASNFTIAARSPSSLWGVDVQPKFLLLSPLNTPGGVAEGDVLVTLTAPGTVQVGDPEAVNRVTLTVTPIADNGRPQHVDLEGRISGPDLYASRIDLNTTTPYGGDPLDVIVRLGNNGNRPPAGPVNVSVVALASGGAQTIVGTRTLNASDFAAGTVRDVRFTWDTTGLQGAMVLQATVDPADTIREIDETNNLASLALTLREPNSLRLIPPREGHEGHPGERVTYNADPHVFLVQYTGTLPQTQSVRVEILSEHGWIEADRASVGMDLPSGALLPIPVDFTIPALPLASSDRLTVRVVPADRPAAALEASILTTVLDDAKPIIGAVTAEPATATLGQNVTIAAEVTDATGLASVRANVVTPTGEVESLLLLPRADGRFAASQPWSSTGTYSILITATDNVQPTPNVNESKVALATFTVASGSKPVIALAPDQPSTIHTGSVVRLVITDPLGIAKANYTVGGLTYDMGRNYTLDTSKFKAGTVEVVVSAENLYHAATTTKLTFTVDNTPPGIRAITLTPSTPKAGEDTLVHVETDTEVTGVQVRIKKDGQLVRTVDATRKGAGVFELTFNPEAGAYSVDVVATDVAGNTKDGQVSFAAKTGSIPGPELALVALALLGIALEARRRT